jgi:hypothetical protein
MHTVLRARTATVNVIRRKPHAVRRNQHRSRESLRVSDREGGHQLNPGHRHARPAAPENGRRVGDGRGGDACVEAITVEPIAIDALAVKTVAVEALARGDGCGRDDRVERVAVETLAARRSRSSR